MNTFLGNKQKKVVCELQIEKGKWASESNNVTADTSDKSEGIIGAAEKRIVGKHLGS